MGFASMLLMLAAPAAVHQCAGDAVSRPLLFIIMADNDRDLDAVMAHYTADPIFIPPNRPPIRGRQAIRQSYLAMYRDFDPDLSIAVESVNSGDGVATVKGRTYGTLRSRAGSQVRTVNDGFEALVLCEGYSWEVASLRWWPADTAKPAR